MPQNIESENGPSSIKSADECLITGKEDSSCSLNDSEEFNKCKQILQEIEIEKEKLNDANANSPTTNPTASAQDIEAGLTATEQVQGKYLVWKSRTVAIVSTCVASIACIIVLVVVATIISKNFMNPYKNVV